MLVHAATAPRAMALVLPSLPQELWVPSYETAWVLSAAVSAAYRPDTGAASSEAGWLADETADRALASGDEHAIKFTEVALESHRRGNPQALPSASRCISLIEADA